MVVVDEYVLLFLPAVGFKRWDSNSTVSLLGTPWGWSPAGLWCDKKIKNDDVNNRFQCLWNWRRCSVGGPSSVSDILLLVFRIWMWRWCVGRNVDNTKLDWFCPPDNWERVQYIMQDWVLAGSSIWWPILCVYIYSIHLNVCTPTAKPLITWKCVRKCLSCFQTVFIRKMNHRNKIQSEII